MNEKMQYAKMKHLIVMVLTLFVVCGIIFGSKSFDVSAANEIEEVELEFDVTPLVDGMTYKEEDYKDVCSVKTIGVVPAECEVMHPTTVNAVRWYYGRSTIDADKIKDEDKFKFGEEYTAHLFLKAKSGYTWKKNDKNEVLSNIKVNGGTVYKASYTHSEEIAVSICFKADDNIDKVECKVKAPLEGNKPSKSVSFTGEDKDRVEFYDIAGLGEVNWFKVDGSNYTIMNDDEVFEAGKQYEIRLGIRAKKNYTIKPGCEWYINDKEAKRGLFVTYIFTALPTVKEIKFTIPEPVIGETPGKINIEADIKNAIPQSIIDNLNATSTWSVSNDGKNYKEMKLTDKFEAGKYYRNGIVSGWVAGALIIEMFGGSVLDQNYAGGSVLKAKYFANGKEFTVNEENGGYVDFGKLEAPATPTPTATPTPVVSPTPAVPTTSPNGIAAEGTELKDLEAVVVETDNDKDLAGAEYGKLQAKASKVTKNSIKLTWNNLEGADGYIIYGNKCSKNNKYLKIKELPAEKKSFTQKKLKKGTYYKYLVVAVKNVGGKQVVVSTSKTIHAATKGGKVGNAKTIKVKNVSKNKKTIKLGKKFTLKTKQVAEKKSLKIKNHRKISFESSDTSIATVSSKGKIKAVGKGKCYIYVYAQNGVSSKVKITVK